MGLTPPRCALRGQRYALSKFPPSKFVTAKASIAIANIGSADGPKGEARDVPSQTKVRVREVSQPNTEGRLLGGPLYLAGRLGFEPR